MKNTLKTLWTSILLLIFYSCFGQKLNQDIIQQADQYVSKIRQKNKIPGLSVAVSKNGKIIWKKGFGFTNIKKKIPATPETVYRIGSVSKVLTIGAAAKLYETNKLSWNKPVQHYVPEFPKKKYSINVMHLASHTSGIRHYNFDESDIDKKHYSDVIDAMELYENDSLLHIPLNKYTYSSYGYNLISAVIQKCSKKSFLDYMEEEIFKPLKMKNTYASNTGYSNNKETTFYRTADEESPKIDISYKWAGGGYLSTVTDLIQYGNAYLKNSFIKPKTRKILMENIELINGEKHIYGLGWIVDELENGDPVWYHGGHIEGGHAIFMILPASKIVVAILSNRGSNFGVIEANKLTCILENKEYCTEVKGETARIKKMKEGFRLYMKTYQQAIKDLENKEIDSFKKYVSDNFSSEQWENKKLLINQLHALSNIKNAISIDVSNINLGGADIGSKGFIENIVIQGFSYVMHFEREESGWKIIGLERRKDN